MQTSLRSAAIKQKKTKGVIFHGESSSALSTKRETLYQNTAKSSTCVTFIGKEAPTTKAPEK